MRLVYAWLLRCHPAPFRRRFGAEMLGIFDETAGLGKAPLLADAAVSLFRQWVLRPEFRRPAEREPVPAAAPPDAALTMFASLDCDSPRPSVFLKGAIVSLTVLCALTAAVLRPGPPSSWLIGVHAPTGDQSPVSRSSLTETEPNTLVRFGPEPANPWRAVAAVYFKAIPVLDALDANHDYVISPWEIATAPSALLRLDRNHDGRLSADECGFRSGDRIEFMRLHPALAALDTNGDGIISADEIEHSAQALRGLDRNGDGFLTPDEVMPEQAAVQAAGILFRLDKDHDGGISLAERAADEAEPLRAVIESADRNRDGITTLAELTRELSLREESAKEKDRALKAAPH